MKKVYYALIVLCILMTQWPLSLIGNRIEPFVFGMPFSISWVVIWICIGCAISLVAAITNFSEKKGGKK